MLSNFVAGNLAVLRVGDGVAAPSSAATAVFIDEFTTSSASQTPVQSVALPTTASATGNAALTQSGSASSEGALSLSQDGHYLALVGYNATTGSTSVASGTADRIVGRIDSSATIDTTTRPTGYSGNNIRGAATGDGTTFWTVGPGGGINYVPLGGPLAGATVQLATANTETAQAVNNQLYVAPAAGVAIDTVGTGLPTTGSQPVANLPGMIGLSTATRAFYFLDRDASVPGLDTLYVADQTNGIMKYSFDGTNWTARGSKSGAVSGLVAALDGANADIYVTTGASASANNNLLKYVDSAAFNATISLGTSTTLATAGTNKIFRGLAFAPTPSPAAQTTTTLSAPTSANANTPINISATIARLSGSGPTPTGTVTFRDGGVVMTGGSNVPVVNGTASFSTSALVIGSHTILATYSPSDPASFQLSNSAATPLTISGPVFTSINNAVFTSGTPGTFQVNSTTATSYSLTSAPPWAAISNAGVLSGTPPAVTQTTAFNFTINGSDSGGAGNAQSFTLYVVPAATSAVPFTPGNLLVYRVGDGGLTYGSQGSGGTASGSAVGIFLDEYTPAGNFVQTVFVPSTGANKTTDSNSATSDGMMTLSADGHSVAFTGYNADLGTANLTSIASSGTGAVARVIGTVSSSGEVDTSTMTTAYSAGNIRSAATIDGKEFWTAGTAGTASAANSGVRYFNVTGATGQAGTILNNTFNSRTVGFYGGQLYWGTGTTNLSFNSGAGTYAFPTPFPTTAPTGAIDTGLVAASTSPYQFVILDMDASGTLTAGDRAYFVDDTSGVGSLRREDYTGTAWSAPTAVATNFNDVRGLTGVVVNSTTARLFGTRATATIAATSSYSTAIVTVDDVVGSGATWSTVVQFADAGSTASPVRQFRGITIVPQAPGVASDTVSLTPSVNPAPAGSSVTFTASITGSAGTATGYVSFLSGTTVLLTTPLVNGQAVYNAPNLPLGATAISTYYGGDSVYPAGTASVNQVMSGLQYTSLNNTKFTSASPGTFNVTVTGGTPQSFSLTGAPAWVAIDSSGVLSGTPPTIVQTTAFPFTINATDSFSNVYTQSFTLYVIPAVKPAVPFTPGDLLVYRVGDGGTTYGSQGTGGNAAGVAVGIFLDEYTPSGAFVQTVFVPTTGANKTVDSISVTSDGMLSLSADGRQVTFTGYNADPGTANLASTTSAANPRVIGIVNGSGVTTTNTTSSAYSGSNIRSAATVNGTQFWTAGVAASSSALNSGIRYFDTAGAANQPGVIANSQTTFDTRTVAFEGGVLYWGTLNTFGAGAGLYNEAS
ncbi:MAG TPA: Ig-like domain-containing protein, partial [Gemmataceae bacterium]|nr:Ig-like domain-containing protein [Gemmataceae bacterium]